MELKHDSSRQPHYEIPVGESGSFRVSLIKNGGYGTECLRIQIRDSSGHLRQGPEIPKSQVLELISALSLLAAHKTEA
jgi:hypothetical protein